jgi:hypothetical protein
LSSTEALCRPVRAWSTALRHASNASLLILSTSPSGSWRASVKTEPWKGLNAGSTSTANSLEQARGHVEMPLTVRDEVIALVFREAKGMVVVMEVNASRIAQRQDG